MAQNDNNHWGRGISADSLQQMINKCVKTKASDNNNSRHSFVNHLQITPVKLYYAVSA